MWEINYFQPVLSAKVSKPPPFQSETSFRGETHQGFFFSIFKKYLERLLILLDPRQIDSCIDIMPFRTSFRRFSQVAEAVGGEVFADVNVKIDGDRMVRKVVRKLQFHVLNRFFDGFGEWRGVWEGDVDVDSRLLTVDFVVALAAKKWEKWRRSIESLEFYKNWKLILKSQNFKKKICKI